MEVRWNQETHLAPDRISWETYFIVDQVSEVKKKSYFIMKEGLPQLPDFTLTRLDHYSITEPLVVDASKGVLSNDEQLSSGEMKAFLNRAPSQGFIQMASDGGFSYQPRPGFIGIDTITYTVWSNGTESVETTVLLEVVQPSKETAFYIGPVPTDDRINVRSELSIDQLDVLDMEGRLVQSLSPNSRNFDIDLGSLSAGSYALRFGVGQDQWVRKVIVY